MTERKIENPGRRGVLRAGVAVLASGAATGLTVPQAARAQTPAPAKLAQKVVMYQETPKNGLQCDGCAAFLPPDGCKLVEGKISPTGWCVAFSPKKA